MISRARGAAAGRLGPWHLGDHLAVVSVNLICAGGMLACWVGAALQLRWKSEMSWLEASIVAVMVVSTADGIWLITALRSVRAARRSVIIRARALEEPAIVVSERHREYVSGPRMAAFHAPSCLLVEGKEVRPVTRADIRRGTRRACPVCIP